MNILFYKAEYGTWLDKLISVATFSKYSHCELQFSDGMCGTSSIRDNGVRLKMIQLHPSHWDIFNVETVQAEGAIRYWFKTYAEEKYDHIGAICSAFGFNPNIDNNRWFCSELCGIFTCGENDLSPGALYKKLKKTGKIK